MKSIALFFVLVSACTSTKQVTFNIDSDPQGAVVETDGILVCKSTPCSISLPSKTRWFTGNCKSKNVTFTATPPRSIAKQEYLMHSTKTVNPCQANVSDQTIFFNLGPETMRLEEVIETRSRTIKN